MVRYWRGVCTLILMRDDELLDFDMKMVVGTVPTDRYTVDPAGTMNNADARLVATNASVFGELKI